MSWKLWAWQRLQQFVGAIAVLIPAGVFLGFLVTGELPGEDFRQDIPISNLDHRQIDHVHIAVAIGSCHMSASPANWPDHWLEALRLDRRMLRLASTETAGGASDATASDLRQQELTSFERAAIYHSDRILRERAHYLLEAEQRQDRVRRNQLRILLLSAAGAFLVGMTTLVVNKDADAPFRSLTRGAMLPISALALLMPLLSTAMSGLVAFDDDGKIALRDLRTVAQLEQLHGRVAEDVTSDPFRCAVTRAAQDLERGAVRPAPSDNPAKLSLCLMDRMKRTVAWEQRHEQILNDATQTLAKAGDLARPGDDPPPSPTKAEQVTQSRTDPCQEVFGAPRRSAGGLPAVGDRPNRS
jgi:hypothetical protein